MDPPTAQKRKRNRRRRPASDVSDETPAVSTSSQTVLVRKTNAELKREKIIMQAKENRFLELAKSEQDDMKPVLEEMQSLLDYGVNVNVGTEQSPPALFISKKCKVVEFLLNNSADPNDLYVSKWIRPLGHFCRFPRDIDQEECYSIINMLLSRGARIDSSLLCINSSPLYIITTLPKENPYRKDLLNRLYTLAIKYNNDNDKLLAHCIDYGMLDPVLTTMCRKLIKRGCNPNVRTKTGYTTVMRFCKSEAKFTFDLINLVTLDTLDTVSVFGLSAIALAASEMKLSVVRALLARGANPNLGRRGELTALASVAGRCGNKSLKIAELLIEHGADVNLGTPGNRPLDRVAIHFIEMKDLLLRNRPL